MTAQRALTVSTTRGSDKTSPSSPRVASTGSSPLGDSFFVTSWQGGAIYRGKLGDKFEVAFPDQKGAADIGFDSKRSRLLVPKFLDSAVEVYEVK